MAKEDISLPVEMGKLEIEPVKTKTTTESNPFNNSIMKRHSFPKTISQTWRCHCLSLKSNRSMSICKKKNNKILKKPVLKILQNFCKDNDETQKSHHCSSKKSSVQSVCSESSLLCALVDNCNQLRISTDVNDFHSAISTTRNDTKWWKKGMPCLSLQNKDAVSDRSRPGPSCSQQALNPPCDVTIDELASYFETLVHIPKKMSSMAEMMYI